MGRAPSGPAVSTRYARLLLEDRSFFFFVSFFFFHILMPSEFLSEPRVSMRIVMGA